MGEVPEKFGQETESIRASDEHEQAGRSLLELATACHQRQDCARRG